MLVAKELREKEKQLKTREEAHMRQHIDSNVRDYEQKNYDEKEQSPKNRPLKILKEEEDRQKEAEFIKIREWEEKFDREQKQKEQDEIRREQRLIQKEIEKRARFDEIDKNLKSSSSGLENFNIDKSKEN